MIMKNLYFTIWNDRLILSYQDTHEFFHYYTLKVCLLMMNMAHMQASRYATLAI
jgi:hypothetical protein